MKTLSSSDFSNENFKFSTGKEVDINSKTVWVQRISYVGELGFELYINVKDAKGIYERIMDRGREFNISNCGLHALDILRMESGFVHWGHDISPEENQYQAGLSFTINYKKNVDFIGKQALLKIKEKHLDKRLMMFVLENSKPGKPLMLHDEPIYLEDRIIGRTTSGNFSFNFNKNLSYGYVNSGNTLETLKNSNVFLEIEKKKYRANVLDMPLNNKDYKNA